MMRVIEVFFLVFVFAFSTYCGFVKADSGDQYISIRNSVADNSSKTTNSRKTDSGDEYISIRNSRVEDKDNEVKKPKTKVKEQDDTDENDGLTSWNNNWRPMSTGTTNIPDGMEVKKVGDVNVVIPKGGKFVKIADSLYAPEGADEYAARNFIDIEARFEKLEKQQAILEQQIQFLKNKLKID